MTELTKKTTGFLAEFRQFIARGNVLDMAVGVIIGGAFGKISTSLVNDILMPLLSLLTGGADFSQWQWVLREAVYDAGGSEVRAAVAINYGSFLSTILDFLIIAFAVFCLIKAINRFHRKKEAAPPPPPPAPALAGGSAAGGDPRPAEGEDMMEQRLQSGLAALNLPVEGIPALVRYGDLLIETNKVMNLTAITDPEDVATLHFLDSAALLTLESFSGKSVVDVGTGAGFPGLPLRVLEPSIRLTLLDSLNKRIQFLETVCRELDLPDVACVHARAEEFAAEHRETFDLAVSRAVAALPVLCELCLPLVKPGGKFLAMKSVESDAELAAAQHAIAILGGAVEAVRDYAIPGTDVRHRLIVVEKVKKTPEKYPRMFAKIKKNPL